MMPGQQSMIGGSSMQQTSVNNTGVPGGVLPDVDMSHLSEEERMLIESVMAKAQMEELELEQSVVKPPTNSRYSLPPFTIICNINKNKKTGQNFSNPLREVHRCFLDSRQRDESFVPVGHVNQREKRMG